MPPPLFSRLPSHAATTTTASSSSSSTITEAWPTLQHAQQHHHDAPSLRVLLEGPSTNLPPMVELVQTLQTRNFSSHGGPYELFLWLAVVLKTWMDSTAEARMTAIKSLPDMHHEPLWSVLKTLATLETKSVNDCLTVIPICLPLLWSALTHVDLPSDAPQFRNDVHGFCRLVVDALFAPDLAAPSARSQFQRMSSKLEASDADDRIPHIQRLGGNKLIPTNVDEGFSDITIQQTFEELFFASIDPNNDDFWESNSSASMSFVPLTYWGRCLVAAQQWPQHEKRLLGHLASASKASAVSVMEYVRNTRHKDIGTDENDWFLLSHLAISHAVHVDETLVARVVSKTTHSISQNNNLYDASYLISLLDTLARFVTVTDVAILNGIFGMKQQYFGIYTPLFAHALKVLLVPTTTTTDNESFALATLRLARALVLRGVAIGSDAIKFAFEVLRCFSGLTRPEHPINELIVHTAATIISVHAVPTLVHTALGSFDLGDVASLLKLHSTRLDAFAILVALSQSGDDATNKHLATILSPFISHVFACVAEHACARGCVLLERMLLGLQNRSMLGMIADTHLSACREALCVALLRGDESVVDFLLQGIVREPGFSLAMLFPVDKPHVLLDLVLEALDPMVVNRNTHARFFERSCALICVLLTRFPEHVNNVIHWKTQVTDRMTWSVLHASRADNKITMAHFFSYRCWALTLNPNHDDLDVFEIDNVEGIASHRTSKDNGEDETTPYPSEADVLALQDTSRLDDITVLYGAKLRYIKYWRRTMMNLNRTPSYEACVDIAEVLTKILAMKHPSQLDMAKELVAILVSVVDKADDKFLLGAIDDGGGGILGRGDSAGTLSDAGSGNDVMSSPIQQMQSPNGSASVVSSPVRTFSFIEGTPSARFLLPRVMELCDNAVAFSLSLLPSSPQVLDLAIQCLTLHCRLVQRIAVAVGKRTYAWYRAFVLRRVPIPMVLKQQQEEIQLIAPAANLVKNHAFNSSLLDVAMLCCTITVGPMYHKRRLDNNEFTRAVTQYIIAAIAMVTGPPHVEAILRVLDVLPVDPLMWPRVVQPLSHLKAGHVETTALLRLIRTPELAQTKGISSIVFDSLARFHGTFTMDALLEAREALRVLSLTPVISRSDLSRVRRFIKDLSETAEGIVSPSLSLRSGAAKFMQRCVDAGPAMQSMLLQHDTSMMSNLDFVGGADSVVASEEDGGGDDNDRGWDAYSTAEASAAWCLVEAFQLLLRRGGCEFVLPEVDSSSARQDADVYGLVAILQWARNVMFSTVIIRERARAIVRAAVTCSLVLAMALRIDPLWLSRGSLGRSFREFLLGLSSSLPQPSSSPQQQQMHVGLLDALINAVVVNYESNDFVDEIRMMRVVRDAIEGMGRSNMSTGREDIPVNFASSIVPVVGGGGANKHTIIWLSSQLAEQGKDSFLVLDVSEPASVCLGNRSPNWPDFVSRHPEWRQHHKKNRVDDVAHLIVGASVSGDGDADVWALVRETKHAVDMLLEQTHSGGASDLMIGGVGLTASVALAVAVLAARESRTVFKRICLLRPGPLLLSDMVLDCVTSHVMLPPVTCVDVIDSVQSQLLVETFKDSVLVPVNTNETMGAALTRLVR